MQWREWLLSWAAAGHLGIVTDGGVNRVDQESALTTNSKKRPVNTGDNFTHSLNSHSLEYWQFEHALWSYAPFHLFTMRSKEKMAVMTVALIDRRATQVKTIWQTMGTWKNAHFARRVQESQTKHNVVICFTLRMWCWELQYSCCSPCSSTTSRHSGFSIVSLSCWMSCDVEKNSCPAYSIFSNHSILCGWIVQFNMRGWRLGVSTLTPMKYGFNMLAKFGHGVKIAGNSGHLVLWCTKHIHDKPEVSHRISHSWARFENLEHM